MRRIWWRVRRWAARVVCMFRGHHYPQYEIRTWCLYSCVRGCGHFAGHGYLSGAQLEKALDDLPSAPPDWGDDYFEDVPQ